MMSAGEPQATVARDTVAPIAVPRPWPLLATALTLALIAMGLTWELVLDPLRPGGSWLALKVIPLVFGVKGLWQGRIYTFKWMSLLIWIYVGEALVRVMGFSPQERLLAGVSLALSLGLAISILWGARQFFKQRAVRVL